MNVCTYPWTHFRFLPTKISPCCNMHMEYSANIRDSADLMSILNAREMVQLRKKLIARETKGLPCEHCKIASFSVPSAEPYAKALKAIQNHETIIGYTTPVMAFFSSYRCNIRCIMCCSKGNGFTNKQTINIDYSSIFDIIKCEDTGVLVFCGGGELFFTPSGIQMLTSLSQKRHLDKIQKEITTNGLLIYSHLDLIKNISNVKYNISIDGAFQGYENIRLGAKWDILERNIDILCELAQSRADISIQISCLVMRSSVNTIIDLVYFCIKRNLRIHLSYVQNEQSEVLESFSNEELSSLEQTIYELKRLQAQSPNVLSEENINEIRRAFQIHIKNKYAKHTD